MDQIDCHGAANMQRIVCIVIVELPRVEREKSATKEAMEILHEVRPPKSYWAASIQYNFFPWITFLGRNRGVMHFLMEVALETGASAVVLQLVL